MRCFLMNKGRIATVRLIENAKDDEEAIQKACALFVKEVRNGFEGFELWDRERFLFRYPEDETRSSPGGAGKAAEAPGARKGPKHHSLPVPLTAGIW